MHDSFAVPRRRPSSVAALLAVAVAAPLALVAVVAAGASAQPAQRLADQEIFRATLLWPEEQRAFAQEGPGLLLPAGRVEELIDVDRAGRGAWIDSFLDRDPDPSTPENELRVGIEKRRALVFQELPSFQDVRAELLFLHGPPQERQIIDCAETFRPIELWRYPEAGAPDGVRTLILYRPDLESPFQLWLPLEGKRVLYIEEMVYYLEQWEEMKRYISGGKRIDRFFCAQDSRLIDKLTGISGLYGFERARPEEEVYLRYLRAPDDLAAWAKKAAATYLEGLEPLAGLSLDVRYPERVGGRMLTRLEIAIPQASMLEVFETGESKELRVAVEGRLERPGKLFEDFRVRFQVDIPELGPDGRAPSDPLLLVSERKLRPSEAFLLRLRITDEISGRSAVLSRGFMVPIRETPLEEEPVSEGTMVALGENLAEQQIPGYDSLVLIPPVEDVVFGLWRAEALVTGATIQRVRFLVDGEAQLTRKGAPYTAEVRLSTYPKEQTVRAEGLDDAGEVVVADEVVLNQPRGELRVRITEPGRGGQLQGEVTVKAEIVVPEEKRVVKVDFLVDDAIQFSLDKPPWEGKVIVPAAQQLSYLTVVAELNDGLRAEDVRFLNAPDYIEEVDVDLVELYTTVMEKNGGLARGLEASDFEVWEDGRPQEIVKFELVDDLPLSVGIAIDTSGSMFESLGEAQRAALGFLDSMITARDRAFALAFNDRPEMLMARTSDVGAIAERLENLVADGATSLHDATVTSLYYFRGVRGRRALIILSDGEDTASTLGFAETLEYARRSGVAIYAIGLRISKLDFSVRGKLDDLAEATGGRTFYINAAEDLATAYAEIERELRSQYLVAYESDQGLAQSDGYREIEMKVQGGKLRARTIKGYYP